MTLVIESDDTKETIRERLKQLFETYSKKEFDVAAFCGILRINGDPLYIQKRLRDEWS